MKEVWYPAKQQSLQLWSFRLRVLKTALAEQLYFLKAPVTGFT